MYHLDALLSAIRQQMQPAGRAMHQAAMLQVLCAVLPDEVHLGDLIVGWQALSRPLSANEPDAVTHRREVCAELVTMAAALTSDPGHMGRAITAWRTWQALCQQSLDPRLKVVGKTIDRELAELHTLAA